MSTLTGAGQLSVARYSLAAAAANNKIIFGGGFNGSISLDVIDVDDVSTGVWSSTSTGEGRLYQARAYLAAASAGSTVVFAGGIASGATIDVYDALSRLNFAITTTAGASTASLSTTTAVTSTTSEGTNDCSRVPRK